jgi:fatty-acyl-CoA synthase
MDARRTVEMVRVLARAGVLRLERPDRLVRALARARRWGPSPAGGIAAAAVRHPDAVAVADDAGTLRFRELHERSNALARALRARGLGAGDTVALMCRNHRGFIEATVACAKLGTTIVYMNTMFSGPQLAAVAVREGVKALLYDAEFAGLLAPVAAMPRYVAWAEGESRDPTLDDLIREASAEELEPPKRHPRFVILTSGTTGTPKGAQRGAPPSIAPAVTLISAIPLRAGERTMIAAPLFHSWGFAHFNLGLLLGSTYVLRRRFDPEQTLRAVAEEGCTALIVVPVMMQRILRLPDEVKRRYRVDRLRVTAVSGSALPGELAREWMDAFGDNLYNLYGSTEVAWASIAGPRDLRAAPGTAGRVPAGTRVRVVDEQGRDVPPGVTGRIFVRNEMAFEGYTGGGGKQELEGLLSSGDVGHFDAEGRLYIDGRDDEMIVSGGENVFPREVEDLLAAHEAVADVAVIGVTDPEWGQRLKAFVVRAPGATLTEAEVKELVKKQLASYKVPRDVVFLDELPRNPTGKILKRELA